MRRLGGVVVAVGVGLVVWVLPASGAAGASPGKVYVALGDSVTQVGSDLRYPERFFAFLKRSGAADALRNVGVIGATSGSILGSQLTQALQVINDGGTDTSVVTLDIGGDDVLGGCNVTSSAFSLPNCQPALRAFARNYVSLLKALTGALAKDPGAEQLIVMAYYNPWSGRAGQETTAHNTAQALLGSDGKIDCTAQGEALGLNDLIACLGARHGTKLADVYPPFVGKGSEWFADQIHPNADGHTAIAKVFADASVRMPDRTPPVLSRLSFRGRTFHLRLSERARVTLTLRRIGRHGRVGRSLGTLTHTLGKGNRKFTLPRRLKHRRVGTGRFRAALAPVDTAGNHGRTRTIRIRVRH